MHEFVYLLAVKFILYVCPLCFYYGFLLSRKINVFQA